jgi:hypothetical protein
MKNYLSRELGLGLAQSKGLSFYSFYLMIKAGSMSVLKNICLWKKSDI